MMMGYFREKKNPLFFHSKMMNAIRFFDDAKLPTRADEGSAGNDLYAQEDCIIDPWERKLISTGIGLQIPHGYYGRIASRSSMGMKCSDIGAGVIDSSYRGEIKVLLINSSSTTFQVKKGDKIAQIIFEKCFSFDFQVVSKLDDSERNSKGFGSSGK